MLKLISDGNSMILDIEGQSNKSCLCLVPERTPGGVTCEGVTSAGIQLKWDLLPPDILRGRLTSYKIYYQEVSTIDLKDSKLIKYLVFCTSGRKDL